MSTHTVQRNKKARAARRKVVFLSAAMLIVLCICLIDAYLFPLRYFWAFASVPDISARQEGELRVHFLDVGQGDSILLEFPDGKNMLIDGGDSSETVCRNLIRYCKGLKIDTFNYILLTHPDTDHAGGLDDVLRVFGAETVFYPKCDPDCNAAYRSFLTAADKYSQNRLISCLYRNIVSETAENFYYLMFLSPFLPEIESSYYTAANEENPSSEVLNNVSAVTYLEYAGRRMILTGDATVTVEDQLVHDYTETEGEVFVFETATPYGTRTLRPNFADIDFLKAGHHGSASSTGEAFCELLKPDCLFVSAGAGNPYGHPSLAAMENVLAVNEEAEIYRTDELGNILLTIAEDGSYTVDWMDF